MLVEVAMTILYAGVILSLALYVHGLPQPHVVGGSDAPPGKYPYQVSLRHNGRHFCGGSVISKRYILTAGHCVLGKFIGVVTIHVGTNLLSEEGDKYMPVTAVTLGKPAGSITDDDVALIRVSPDIKFTKKVAPVELASFGVEPGSTAIVTGWGRLSAGGTAPNALQQLNLTVIPNTQCRKHYPTLKSNTMCTLTKKGEGVCNGDSGGPLVVNGIQVGVVSYGLPCAHGTPDVYAKVADFRNWIDRNLALENPVGNITIPKPDDDKKPDPRNSAFQSLASVSLILSVVLVTLSLVHIH